MIAIDTSALMALLLAEPEQMPFIAIIGQHDQVLLGTPTALEFRMVCSSRSLIGIQDGRRCLSRPHLSS